MSRNLTQTCVWLCLAASVSFGYAAASWLAGLLGQDIFLDGSEHESLKNLDKPLNIFQLGWLVPEATEPTKATLTTVSVPFEMTIDVVQNKSYCFREAGKTESNGARDREGIVVKKSREVRTWTQTKTRHKLCGRSLKTNQVAST